MVYFLSFLPLLVLIILSLTKGVKTAVMIGAVLSLVLFFYWGAEAAHLGAVLGVTTLITLNILMILFGAAFLFNVMSNTGMINRISQSINNLHSSKDIQFFLLAFGLTAFFEGVAGFGTPGAIVPIILIGLGYEAILSVSVVLLLDGIFAMFGAVGTPIFSGLQLPLDLNESTIQEISFISSVLMFFAGGLLLMFIFRMVRKQRQTLVHKKEMFMMYVFFGIPVCVYAWIVPELATVLGSFTMLILSVLYLRKRNAKIDYKAWIPYALLALLLLIPKLWPDLRMLLSWELEFPDMFGTGIGGEIRPLYSPLIPFLIIGCGAALLLKNRKLYLKDSLQKVGTVSLILFPLILIAQLMIHSGVSQPSMVGYISMMISKLGAAYPVFAPFIGIMGTFITGSTTVSNIVVGPSQFETAIALNLNTEIILALQLTGASLGNSICLFNIIAAAAIVQVKNYKGIFGNNLAPVLISGLFLGLMGLIMLIITGNRNM